MKKLIARLIPESFRSAKRIRKEPRELADVAPLACDPAHLVSINQFNLSDIFYNQTIETEWNAAKEKIDACGFTAGTGGINKGDRKAIYYLIKYFKPQTVLEVGTHVGASTVHIATAMQPLERDKKLTTVDISNVNDIDKKPWLNYGAKYAPAESIQKLQCQHFVNFVVSPSLEFMNNTSQTFDFIFLDGDHAAKTVYKEVPAALKLLNENGIILLHDFFPNMKPLWANKTVHPGPYLAIERLKSEGAPLQVIPLDKLPWPTKQLSNVTSLALLVKSV